MPARLPGEDELADRVRRLLAATARLELDPATLPLDRPLLGEGGLGIHSLEVFEFVCALEEEFGIAVADDALVPPVSLRSIVDYVRSHQPA